MNHHLARKIEGDENKRKSIEEGRPTGHEAEMDMTDEIDIGMTNDEDQIDQAEQPSKRYKVTQDRESGIEVDPGATSSGGVDGDERRRSTRDSADPSLVGCGVPDGQSRLDCVRSKGKRNEGRHIRGILAPKGDRDGGQVRP